MSTDEEYIPEAKPSRRVLVRTAPAAEAAPVEAEAPAPVVKPRPKPAAGGASVIRRGWSASQQVMDSASPFAQSLKVTEHSQIIKFLEDEPYASYLRHWIERSTPQGRNKIPFICPTSVGKPCPLCDIGDHPQSVSAFNVALISDDGVAIIKTWDVGVKMLNSIKKWHNDSRIGPLPKGYFMVSNSGKGTTADLIPVKASLLEEDFGTIPPTDEALEALDRYDANILQIPKHSELQEIAAELASDIA